MLHLTLSKRTNKNYRKEIKTETGQPLALCVCVCVCAYVVKYPNCPGTHSVRKAGLLRTGVTAPTPGLTCFHSDKEPVVLGLTHLDTGLLRVCFHGLQGCQCSPILHNDAAVLRLA